jgi:uncharacterized membrane protein
MLEQPFIIPSIIFIIAALPTLVGIIPRNKFYGIRTIKTLAEDRIWYKANKFFSILLIICSIIYFVTAVIFPYSRYTADNFSVWLIHLCAFIFPLLLSFIVTNRFIRRL